MNSVSCVESTKEAVAPVPQQPPRFVFVDGLRGIAALGIATYHIWRYEPPIVGSMPPDYAAARYVPWVVDWMLLHTWFGVNFLLVVSGFVIAYTLRNTWVTTREAVSFVGRRIVRLWPPYAVTILIVVLLHAAAVVPTPPNELLSEEQFPSSISSHPSTVPPPTEEPLTAVRILAHLFFLQDVLGQSPLSAGIWTVCIEVQFYFVCVLAWGLAQRILPRPDPQQPRPSASGVLLLFAPLAFSSLVLWNWQDHTEPWVTHFLGSFFLGLVTWWTLDGTVPLSAFVVTVAAVIGQMAMRWKPELGLTLGTAVAIYLAGRTNHLRDWLNWRWLQYLGRISYSLYLIHYPVSHVLMWAGWRICDNAPTPIQASAILLLCLVASIAAGHLLYVCLEAPSGRWSARLKCRQVPKSQSTLAAT